MRNVAVSAPPPPKEAQRVDALQRHGILDSPPEETFDASLCDVP
jgi:hypothetical protein